MVNKEDVEDTSTHRNELEALNTVDSDERDETIPRGNEWEVVSLTASTYAAAPGPHGDESIHEENSGTEEETNDGETSQALFMSRHFVFPPSQHENLPIEPDNSEIPKEDEVSEDVFSQMNALIEGKSEKEDEHWNLGNFNVPGEFTSFTDVKGDVGLSVHGTEFDDATGLHGLNVADKEPNIFGTTEFSSFHSDAAIDGSAVYDESAVVSDLIEASDQSQSPKSGKEEFDDSELPCGAWWKRGVASICAHAKETSTYWSIFVAAAVMGLVLLGQQWQQERRQVLQQRWQLSVGDEKSGRILSRLKEVIVGGSRRGTYITATSGER